MIISIHIYTKSSLFMLVSWLRNLAPPIWDGWNLKQIMGCLPPLMVETQAKSWDKPDGWNPIINHGMFTMYKPPFSTGANWISLIQMFCTPGGLTALVALGLNDQSRLKDLADDRALGIWFQQLHIDWWYTEYIPNLPLDFDQKDMMEMGPLSLQTNIDVLKESTDKRKTTTLRLHLHTKCTRSPQNIVSLQTSG